jgi:integrase
MLQGEKIKADTVVALKALRPADNGKKIAIGDGLAGEVRAGRDGTVSVHVSWRYRVAGKTREIAIGTWREKDGQSLKALRDERDRLAMGLRNGIDPIERNRADKLKVQADQEQAQADERQRMREIAETERRREDDARAAELMAARRITVRGLFEQWQRVALAPHVRADGTRTGRKGGGQWVLDSFERRLFPKLGEVAAADVRKTDLMTILDDCKAGGQLRTANALLAALKQMFRFALVREIIDRNPLDTVTKADVGGKEAERERVLTTDELRSLVGALPFAGMGPRSVAAVWLILATACRVGEAMAARWEDVDLQDNTWHLPDTKNERPHTIHLSAFAQQQFAALQGLREVTSDGALSPWVFPATDNRNHVDIKTFGKQLADRQREPAARMSGRSKNTRALMLAGGKWTAHDLRRTAATLMAGAGVSTDTIDECLNHKLQSKVARVYIKDRRLPEQARAFDLLGAKLLRTISGEVASSNVIAMPVAA